MLHAEIRNRSRDVYDEDVKRLSSAQIVELKKKNTRIIDGTIGDQSPTGRPKTATDHSYKTNVDQLIVGIVG